MEDFVTFEIAKKLKEKGFREKCFAYYDVLDNVGILFNTQYTDDILPCQYTDLLLSHNEKEVSYPDDSECCVDAPTISQVLKWLREECGIFILVEPDILSPKYKLTFTLRVKYYIKGEEDEGFSEKYLTYRKDSYELAVLTGIEYVLNNLI